jgi:glycosyltransferase involved in cell wall biosynthesis
VNAASPLVSVLVAAHDAERFLGVALRSMLRQTVSDLELVVVDDGSSDGTSELLARLEDTRLVVLRNDERLGLAASLNRALEQARGRYVARLDADDVAMPRRLERQLARIVARPIAIVGSGALELDEAARVGALHLMPDGPVACRWASLFSSPFLHPSVLADRELLERHELRYDPEFPESEDYDLWTRLLTFADGDNVGEPLVLYRVHPSQASRRRRVLQRDFQQRVARRELGRYLPDLAAEERDLLWRLGAGEELAPSEVEDAAAAFVDLVSAFERVHRPPAARRAAARAIARASGHADLRERARVLKIALHLDPLLGAHAAAVTARRRRVERATVTEARAWLGDLETHPERTRSPVRVVAVFPEPTPYRAPLFDRVDELPDLDLTVVYAAETVAGRTWEVEPRHRAVSLRGVRIPGAERILRHDYPVTPGVERVLRRARPDVVVVSGWSTFASQAAIAWCRLRAVPYVLVVESHDEDPRPGWRRAIKGAVVPRVVGEASGVLVTGTLARGSMVARGADPERIGVFGNTIDVEAFAERAARLTPSRPVVRETFGAGADDVVVLSVARLVPDKRLDQLVRAVAEAADPRLLLVLAGGGPERDRLEALADELGVRLVLAGDLPWGRVVEAYVAADVFALLSEREPWGVVVNEAVACGLPLVLSDRVGAAHDLLRDGENGVLVPVNDVSAAARALRRLASDPLARVTYGARSREIAAVWGYEPSVDAFREAVRRAAGR